MVEKWIGRLSNMGGVVAATSIALMVSIILTEVVVRLCGSSILVAQEFTRYLLVLFTFSSLAQVLKKDRHIKVTLVFSRLPQRWQQVLDFITPVLALFLVVYMIYWSSDMAINSLKEQEFSLTPFETPLFIPKVFIPIGLSLFALQLIALLIVKTKVIVKDKRT